MVINVNAQTKVFNIIRERISWSLFSKKRFATLLMPLCTRKPRSMITDSINERLRPYTMAYTTVFRRNTCLSITTVFLRVVYEGIQSFPIANDLSNTSYFTVNDRCTTKCRVFIKMMININFLVSVDDRILPYPIWRNTEPCITLKYDKIRSRRPY